MVVVVVSVSLLLGMGTYFISKRITKWGFTDCLVTWLHVEHRIKYKLCTSNPHCMDVYHSTWLTLCN